MLTITLRKLSRGPVERSGQVALDEEPWTSTDLAFSGPPTFDFLARETGDGVVHVTGSLHAVLELDCRRCLEAVLQKVDLEVDWLYDPGLDAVGEEEGVYPLDREKGSLDLSPQVREELLLAAAPYPLCDSDCAGLCPQCGTNLNEEECDCTREEVDPRWRKLQELKESET